MILDNLKNKSVLILGFGKYEGPGAYRFIRSKFPDKPIAIADQSRPTYVPSDPKITTHFGKKYLNSLKKYDLIIKSAGISPHIPEIVKAKKQNKQFTSITQIFFELCPGSIIGVTGTKGKSTTSSLIYHVLQKNNIASVLVGNIGKPSLDFLSEITPNTWVIHELSSYQLMDLTKSPHIAVLQNIFPDHLDYHKSMREYIAAKANIAKHQTPKDYFIYNADNEIACKIAKLTSATPLPFKIQRPAFPTQLLGIHNQYNIMPSLLIAKILELPSETVFAAIKSFVPLETRLQYVTKARDIRFYADTLATIPEATIAAINALSPNVSTLIAGGHERYQKYTSLAKKILESGVNTLILFPATGPRLWESVKLAQSLFPQHKLPNHFPASSMAEAVKLAFKHTISGKICLLSPAAPSFTLFKDYKDEFDQYKKCITDLSA